MRAEDRDRGAVEVARLVLAEGLVGEIRAAQDPAAVVVADGLEGVRPEEVPVEPTNGAAGQ